MKKQEVISGAVLFLFAAVYLIYNRQYELGTLALPGAGVFPLAIGLFILIMSGLHVFTSLVGKNSLAGESGGPQGAQGTALPAASAGRNNTKAWLIVALVVVFLLFLKTIGFFTMSFLLITASGKLLGIKGWPRALGLGLGATIGSYLIFKLWLNVPLPPGLFL